MPSATIWLKVPLAIIASYIYAAAFKSPNPVLNQSSQVEIKRGKLVENNWNQTVTSFLGTLQIFVAVAEVCLILTRDYPNSPAARIFSWFFVLKGGNPAQLNLNGFHIIAGIMMIIGGFVRVSTFRTLGRFFTFQVGIQRDHKLITNGFYSVVRHPAYAGMLLTNPGVIIWNLTPGSWVRECGILNTKWGLSICLLIAARHAAAVYLIPFGRMPQEDALLKDKFGKEWEQWANKVRYRLIPGIY